MSRDKHTLLFVIKGSALNRGMNTGIENLAWGLAERDLNVHILSGGQKPDSHDYSFPKTVTYHFTGLSGINPHNFLPAFDRIVQEYRIDTVIGWIINTALLIESSVSKDVRFIANLGQMPPRSILLRFLKQSFFGAMSFSEAFRLTFAIKKYARSYECVVSNSNAVNTKSISYYRLDPDKCVVIERGIDTKKYAFHPRRNDTNNTLEMLFAGNICEAKGIGDLVGALRLIQIPVILRLCGSSNGDFLEKISQEIESTIHEIKHMGPVGQEQLINFYQQCDIFVFPSHSEGMPKVLLEAMSCGCPVVCSDIAPHKEVVQDAQNGLIVPVRNPEALSDAILRFASDSALRKTCSHNARTTIELWYNKAIEIDKWVDLL